MRLITTTTFAGVLGLAGACAAQGIHEGDIVLSVGEDGEIVTGTPDEAPVSVFVATMEDGVSDEPGFDSLDGTFDAGEILGLDVLRALRVWDGEDFREVAAPAMTASKFGQEMVSPACDQRVSKGFVFGNADDEGGFHHHVTFFLEPAEPGIYLLSLEVWSQNGTPTPSEPVHLVLEQPGHGQDVGAAAAWVVARLPELRCRADMSNDGSLDVLDFVAMQQAFVASEARADLDGDCTLSVLDFVAFQQAFAAGCD